MADIHPFSGTVLDHTQMLLGEGPSFDPITNKLCWLNILGKELHEYDPATGTKTVHALPFMASVVARIDEKRQLLASEEGLFIRDRATGDLFLHADFEPSKPGNRSNDGRVHQSGALWIGTMGKKAEEKAGSIYHVAKGVVTTLFTDISISNSICFSPDGATGYYVDTKVNQVMSVPLDPATGLPTGTAKVLIDRAGQKGGSDGSVCDADGNIWNACWGMGAVDCYSSDGKHLARYEVPATQSTCPAFFGASANRLAVTSACEGLDAETVKANPLYGTTVDLGIEVNGVFDGAYKV
ncbi:SMP-30/gluconolactonase/LRE family protein [Agrobacterium rubi]|uniref:SMP-30/gluconolactonase/LRE family protein n=1 Tax=Agrobacterium rubi TaxID=28099 RepID=UPI0015734F26|nr:SMP-30/gluconolactonase/LRE family protein [Agrobacterium rubi]NTF06569.1 SMP-30/gluconolactonase/LRE family protein [Agrobacterium rubi]NTF18811.1 SMP-30/gluconolactonase/LRE family protein [Agrobacterium rubi]NTF25774.1 SMP-30/gluconolactonase/LRE family protein [Agrobacterium rubi]